MPSYYTTSRTDNNVRVNKWRFPYWDLDADKVKVIRRDYASCRDELLALQRACGPDHETARFFRNEARDALKIYRAACLILPWLTDDHPGDCELRSPWTFAEELFPALNYVANRAEF